MIISAPPPLAKPLAPTEAVPAASFFANSAACFSADADPFALPISPNSLNKTKSKVACTGAAKAAFATSKSSLVSAPSSIWRPIFIPKN